MKNMPSLNPGRLLLASALLLATAVPALAQTSNLTRQAVNVRSGPDVRFPVVTWLPPRTSVRVFGCTSGFRWCDVSSGRTRGWVDSRYLAHSVRRAPIIGFSVPNYWDRHYRGRPWYPNRNQWSNWGSPGWQPPPPQPIRPPTPTPFRPLN